MFSRFRVLIFVAFLNVVAAWSSFENFCRFSLAFVRPGSELLCPCRLMYVIHSRVVRWLVAIRTASLATTAALRYSAQRERHKDRSYGSGHFHFDRYFHVCP